LWVWTSEALRESGRALPRIHFHQTRLSKKQTDLHAYFQCQLSVLSPYKRKHFNFSQNTCLESIKEHPSRGRLS
jgi:hypothetical protein